MADEMESNKQTHTKDRLNIVLTVVTISRDYYYIRKYMLMDHKSERAYHR